MDGRRHTGKQHGIRAVSSLGFPKLCAIRSIAVMLAALFVQIASADEQRIRDYTHLGVASCASSVCHGKMQRQDDQNVWLNENRLWTNADMHSRAFRLLENEESRRIANNLGLSSATTAKVCLDCHADNVPPERRGQKFQLRDGVGCEACHGGAQEWIESHATEGATHEENLEKGMYPTEAPVERAKLCLSCHMGSAEKFASHEIMGAGHPRLIFELETFTARQPPHFEVDEDYRVRKGEISGFNLWLTGQVESARRFMDLLRQRIDSESAMFPELALYDCHACHHDMENKRWIPTLGSASRPGSPRLQDQHLLMLQIAVSILESPSSQTDFVNSTGRLVRAGQESTAKMTSVAAELGNWLADRQEKWAAREFDADTVIAVRRAIARAAARGRMRDYAAAEQVFFALESLSYSVGDWQQMESTLNGIFSEFSADKTFDPSSFLNRMKSVEERF